MDILRTALLAFAAAVAVGALVDGASRLHHGRLVQTTLDQPLPGVTAWQ
jgi:hypothetical protein